MAIEKVKDQRSKSDFDLYGIILNYVHESKKSPYDLCREMNIDKRHLSYYINRLKRSGAIKMLGYGVWEADLSKSKVKDFSIGTRKEDINLHALNINVPVLSGEVKLIKDFEGYAQKKFNNWIPEYKRMIAPIGFTMKNNNNKSIDLQIWSRKIINLDEIQSVTLRTLYFAQNLLAEKGVKLDVLAAKTRTLHVMVKEEDMNKLMNKGTTIEVLLNRQTGKILNNDEPKDAIAWTDSSPFRGVESNDIQYIKNYILMPEKVDSIARTMIPFAENSKAYAEEIKNHREAINEMRLTLRTINKGLKALNFPKMLDDGLNKDLGRYIG